MKAITLSHRKRGQGHPRWTGTKFHSSRDSYGAHTTNKNMMQAHGGRDSIHQQTTTDPHGSTPPAVVPVRQQQGQQNAGQAADAPTATDLVTMHRVTNVVTTAARTGEKIWIRCSCTLQLHSDHHASVICLQKGAVRSMARRDPCHFGESCKIIAGMPARGCTWRELVLSFPTTEY
jgi:hypothetical protein